MSLEQVPDGAQVCGCYARTGEQVPCTRLRGHEGPHRHVARFGKGKPAVDRWWPR